MTKLARSYDVWLHDGKDEHLMPTITRQCLSLFQSEREKSRELKVSEMEYE